MVGWEGRVQGKINKLFSQKGNIGVSMVLCALKISSSCSHITLLTVLKIRYCKKKTPEMTNIDTIFMIVYIFTSFLFQFLFLVWVVSRLFIVHI